MAVKIKRWEDKNKGEKEKRIEVTREENKRETDKDEQDRDTSNDETNKTKMETGIGEGLSSPEGKKVGIIGGRGLSKDNQQGEGGVKEKLFYI